MRSAADPIRYREDGRREAEAAEQGNSQLPIVCVPVVNRDHDGSGRREPAGAPIGRKLLEVEHGTAPAGKPSQVNLEASCGNNEPARRLVLATERVVHEDCRPSGELPPRFRLEAAAGAVPVRVALGDLAHALGTALSEEPAARSEEPRRDAERVQYPPEGGFSCPSQPEIRELRAV
jgi:hypothetical protein